MVSEWMHTYYGLVRAERLTPPVATRLMAYAAVALYQGLSAATPSLPSLAGQLNGLDGVPGPAPGERYDATLVALAAEHVVLDSMFREALPTTRATLSGLVDSLRQERVALGIGEPVRRRSEELGSRIGQAIVAWAAGDGFDSTRAKSYTPPRGPGFWVNDAPASIYASQNLSAVSEFVALDNPNTTLQPGAMGDRALIQNRPKPAGASALPAVDPAGATEPYWGTLRPFVLRRYDECPIVRPPSYSTDRTSPLYRENQEVVEVQRHLTEEQKAIALYWADNPGETGTPAGHWLAIASQLASQRGLSAEDAVRLFLLTAVAQADAFIAAWGYKYQFNLIRPRTYIRRVIDPAWEPLVPTPPFPEYPSGHSTQSAAASAVLGAVLGQVAFEDSTGLAIGHPVRRFRSFDEAADEAGWSRIYGGIHYHVGKSAGKAVGQCVGAKVIERLSRVVTAGSEAEGRGP
jgi:hypothetical protein